MKNDLRIRCEYENGDSTLEEIIIDALRMFIEASLEGRLYV